MKKLFRFVPLRSCILSLAASIFLAFGLFNVHAQNDVTEGGVLGMTLLLERWFGVSPSISSAIMNLACYAMGFHILGRSFILLSVVPAAGFSASYRIFETIGPILPDMHPLAAALAGAVFVGIGAGVCVRMGGAPSGDDALAMTVSGKFHIPIQRVYLVTDAVVLGLSVSYIPPAKLICSVITVILSGQIIGIIQRLGRKQK